MCGLPGSTVLVTTRKDTVAKIMGCAELNIFRPGHLSKEECWSIICDEVMLSGMIAGELELLQDIGLQIADKCRGLPLAAKALGGLLRFKIFREEWQSVLDSEMWELGKEEVEIERNLFAPLWLSYHDLSSAERQCLSYCSIFLKDVGLGKKFLIKLWMAQGYLVETKTKDMEMIGEEYFRNLCARCFFQDFKKGSNGKIKGCKMHDIVHDFVQLISKKECLCMELENNRLDSIRHLYYRYLDISPTVHSFKKLRSLVLDSCGELDLCYLFNELTCLRSLALTNCDISEIPSTIGRLIHLRLLDLHENSELRELPESVCDLCNLLILDLRDCPKIERLPVGIEKLSKLRYQHTGDCMIKLTQGVGRSLNAIRKTSFLVDSEATSMGNLKNLKHLKSVYIHLRRNVEDVVGVRQAKLSEKKHLVSLELSIALFEPELEEEEAEEEDIERMEERWKLEDEDVERKAERWKLHDEELIEALHPSCNLEKLKICGYQGAKPFPSWLLSLNHLRKVEFTFWENCNCFPPLGKLPSLAHLELSGHKNVDKVSLEFLGIEIDGDGDEVLPPFVAFPKLETLGLYTLYEWEEWDMDVGTGFTIMPCLTFLSIVYCPKLKALLDYLLRNTKIKSLQICDCPFLSERYEEDGVDRSKISHIPDIQLDDR